MFFARAFTIKTVVFEQKYIRISLCLYHRNLILLIDRERVSVREMGAILYESEIEERNRDCVFSRASIRHFFQFATKSNLVIRTHD